ncbi:alpha/beta fold hydrolase [Streptomyces sp. NPDC020141]|uniref:alpha/beta fold hydrolase n=1 Tax=Streptomyces sp. NPDC020141 TaxID=3365065 RepID=UPI00379D3A9C
MTDHRTGQSAPAKLARRRALTVSAMLLAGLQASTGLAAARDGGSSAAPALDWRLCSTAAADWPIKNDTRSECAELTVPMDYAKPRGRTITIAVSRVRAAQGTTSASPVVSVLGGPGFSNISDAMSMTRRGLAALNAEHDFIGLDLRGSGYSDHLVCDDRPGVEPLPTAPEKHFKKADFDTQAEFNNRCAAIDPAFVRQITPENAARDIDRLRVALGAEKINFYGASFGTAIGMAYRALFDRRTERMWLDSVMPPTRHWPTMDRETEAVGGESTPPFVAWLAGRDAEHGLGGDESTVRGRLGELRGDLERKPRTGGGVRLDGDWVVEQINRPQEEWDHAAKALAAVRGGGTPPAAPTPSKSPEPSKSAKPSKSATPPRAGGAASEPAAPIRSAGLGGPRSGFNTPQYHAMFCNTAPAGRGFGELWAAREARRKADPLSGGTEFSAWCAKWPLNAPAARPAHGGSALQLSGHLYEYVTPYVWAEQARDATGGALLTIVDDGHASLPSSPCAEKAISFFRTGQKAEGSCGGQS